MNAAHNQPGLESEVFEFERPHKPQQNRKTTPSTPKGKKIYFYIIMSLLTLGPILLFIVNSQQISTVPNTPPSYLNSERMGSPVTTRRSPTASNLSARTSSPPLSLGDYLGKSDLARIDSYPKTAAEKARQESFDAELTTARAAVTAEWSRLNALATVLGDAIKRLEAQGAEHKRATTTLTRAANTIVHTGEKLSAAANTFRADKAGYSYGTPGVGGTFNMPVATIPLTAYRIHSVVGNLVVISAETRPNDYLKLKIGSVLPGHGPLREIKRENGVTTLIFKHGQIGGQ